MTEYVQSFRSGEGKRPLAIVEGIGAVRVPK